ncbi:MAG: hypothetical protein E7256_11175 [Lachnospiraceae bacterium]|nr:hypothetical protein [Lachnospiraceae bacterium]
MKRFTWEMMRAIIFLAYSIGLIILFGSFLQQQNGIRMHDTVTPLSISGTISADGGPFQDIQDTDWHTQNVRSVIVTGFFNQNITDGNSLILWPRNLRVKIYVNGIEKVSTGQREEFPDFIEYAGNSYQIFYIGDISTTDEIRMEVEKAYASCRINVIDSFFENLYTGREGDVYHSILSQEMLHLMISLGLMIIGFLVLIASVLQHFTQFNHIRQIYYLGWFCLVGGISYASDSSYEFIDLIFPYPVTNTLIDLCSIPLLLLIFLFYITNVVKSRQAKRFMNWATTFFAVIEAIPVILQFLGIQDMHIFQDQYVFMGGFIILLSISAITYELIAHRNNEMRKVLISITPFVIALLLKIVDTALENGVERTYIRIGILVSCIMLLHDTFKHIRRSMELLEQEQQIKQEMQNAHAAIMLSQIQPHFLYNALNTLQHICKKDGALAAEAIDHFSKYLRGNMDSLMADRPIPFEDELEHIKHYIYIEQLRFGDRVRVEYNLEVLNFCVPTLTLQPIVENAIRHGITKQAEGGVVQISTRQAEDDIWIIIADNGVGMDQDYSKKNDRSHIGIENVRKRLALQSNGTLSIISSKESGTKVIIHLKGAGDKKNESNGC